MTPQDMDREVPEIDREARRMAEYIAGRVEAGISIWVLTRALWRVLMKGGG